MKRIFHSTIFRAADRSHSSACLTARLLWLMLPLQTQATPGTLDLSFDPAMGVNGSVYCVNVQPDGKALIGGEFYTVRGAARNGIARLHPDGLVDRSFDPGSGVLTVQVESISGNVVSNFYAGKIYSIAAQPDAKVLIGGNFHLVNGVSRKSIARLNADGSLDTDFNVGITGNASVQSIAIQPDGRVLIAGSFTNVGGNTLAGIARLNANGSVDNTFSPGAMVGTPSVSIQTIHVQADGKIIVGGQFSSVGGLSRNCIARLNPDGSVDPTFDPGSGASGISFPYVRSVAVQTDGRIVIGGNFTSVNGTNRNGIARLDTDGSLDVSFDPGTGAQEQLERGGLLSAAVRSVVLQSDGRVVVAGSFNVINGVARTGMARLDWDGSLDDSFGPQASSVNFIAVQSDDKLVLGGSVSSDDGVTQNHVARLHADGSLDAEFAPCIGTGPLPPDISTLALQPDGKVLLGFESYFIDSYLWLNWMTLLRVNADGSWDSTFDPGAGPNGYIRAIVLQTDGKILVGGSFTAVAGTNRNFIARLHPNGILDHTFNPDGGPNGIVSAIAFQPDGKMVIGGGFTAVAGMSRNRIARLHSDGSLDETFDPGTGANGGVSAVVLQPDGRVLLGGSFTNIAGLARNRIARLNADGSLDTTFAPSTGANNWVRTLALQSDGKILIVGKFTSVNGTSRNGIARLNADGSLDDTFNPGSGVATGMFTQGANCVAVQSNGKVLLGGDFSSINGISRSKVARLNPDGSMDGAFDPGLGPRGAVGSGATTVYSLVEQPDGRVLIGGTFDSVSGVTRERVARLLGDGPALVFGPVRDNNDFVARFKGRPGLVYTLESRTNLNSGNWEKLSNVNVPATDEGLGLGGFELRHPIHPAGQRFYRVVYPAY